jgi:hypothetical protein
MKRVFRQLLIWLLLALLPLQGTAAGVLMTCAAGHGLTPTSDQASHAGQQATTVHQHHSEMTADEMATTPCAHNDADHAPTDQSHHHKQFSCSNCGSCCIGALALPASLNVSLQSAKTPVDIVSPPALVAGFIPDGLERPPRNITA